MIKKLFAFVFLLVIAFSACTSPSNLERPVYIPNKQYENIKYLAKQKSPYLLSYVQSKVNWYPWSSSVFKKAKKENKMILVDFGMLSCDECYSKDMAIFENKAVAKFINDHFIPIKVDINERPDIYKFYQQAFKAHSKSTTNSTITALTLPDGKPFWLKASFSKSKMTRTLNFFTKQYYKNPVQIEFVANQLVSKVQNHAKIVLEEPSFKKRKLRFIGDKLTTQIDIRSGGLKSKEKSPVSSSLRFLMRHYYMTENPKVLKTIENSLDKLAMGTAYDHIGGGFYETALNHHIDDFGKTLATNGQLISLYTEAYQLTKKPLYKQVIEETIAFIEAELAHPLGGFYAGKQGKSGKDPNFYLWTKKEAEAAIGNDMFAKIFCEYFNIKETGKYNNKNVLYVEKSDQAFLTEYGLTYSELESMIYVCQQQLLKTRNKRIHPKLDFQVITASNGIILKAYIDAYRVLGHHTYLERANRLANFTAERLTLKNDRLAHRLVNNKSIEKAFLDDYSYMIEAFITLYQADFNEKWLYKAKALGEDAINFFQNDEVGMFHYAVQQSDASFLNNVQIIDIEDSFMPSANASIASGLFKLGLYFEKKEFTDIAKTMLANVQNVMETTKTPTQYGEWGMLYSHFVIEPYEVTIVGKDYEKLRSQWDSNFLPNVFLFGGNDEGTLTTLKGKFIEGETLIYVCKNKICKIPTSQVTEALAQIETKKER